MNKAEVVFEKIALSYDKVIGSIISRNNKINKLPEGVVQDMLLDRTASQVRNISSHLRNIVNKKNISSKLKGIENDAINRMYIHKTEPKYLDELAKYIKENKISRI